MGRSRTLLGTRMIPLRVTIELIKRLDEVARENGESRNTLMARLLAADVLRLEGKLRGKSQSISGG